ncbi:MAG: SDR family oxidoreductase [Candidatus Omnitrophota bacterium]
MELDLKGKIAVITGGTGGLGSALVNAFLQENAFVVTLDKNKEKGREQEECFKDKVCFIETNVADPISVDDSFDLINKKFGCIDILINNAGIFSSVPFLEIKPGIWDDIMRTNLRSVLLCSQRALKGVKEKKCGKIINIASLGGQTGGIFAGADYSASKAGIISLTKSLAKNFGKYGIRVNCVNPGPLETEMTRNWPEDILDNLKKSMLIRKNKLGLAEEVANVVVFLSSDKSALVHGAQIDVNGGMHIR